MLKQQMEANKNKVATTTTAPVVKTDANNTDNTNNTNNTNNTDNTDNTNNTYFNPLPNHKQSMVQAAEKGIRIKRNYLNKDEDEDEDDENEEDN